MVFPRDLSLALGGLSLCMRRLLIVDLKLRHIDFSSSTYAYIHFLHPLPLHPFSLALNTEARLSAKVLNFTPAPKDCCNLMIRRTNIHS